jgi:hypothetical protein
MKVSAKARWTAYAIAAALTALAMWRVGGDGGGGGVAYVVDVAVPPPPRPQPPRNAVDPAPTLPPADDALARLKRQIETALDGGGVDPFSDAPTVAEAQAAAAAQAAAMQQAAAAAVARPPAPPPPPPLRYLGRWQEQGRTRVFLLSGDRVLEVDGPGPLDGALTVVALADDQITLKLPDGRAHTLFFDAPGSAAPLPSAPSVGATPFDAGDGASEEN